MKCLQKSKGRVHPEIDSSLLEKLKEFFKPFDQKFFFLIQQKHLTIFIHKSIMIKFIIFLNLNSFKLEVNRD